MTTNKARVAIILIWPSIFIWTMKMSLDLSFVSLLINIDGSERRTF